ncbi:MAG TPA: CvpA family protein [Gemmataceae bacterium]|nr:CvpA family protein [Gemmataceae bacterium]
MVLFGFFTVLIMIIVGYAHAREGVFTAFLMTCNVCLAGLVAFGFWEPIADELDGLLADSFLHGVEDAFCLMVLFSLTFLLLRWISNVLAPTQMSYHPVVLQGGGAFFGLVTGYLVSGFLLCMIQTLPLPESFAGFDVSREREGLSRVLPPDRVWLAGLRRAGAYTFSFGRNGWYQGGEWTDDPARDQAGQSLSDKYFTFDKYATFELRYARYRRLDETGQPRTYAGELDAEIHRRPPE